MSQESTLEILSLSQLIDDHVALKVALLKRIEDVEQGRLNVDEAGLYLAHCRKELNRLSRWHKIVADRAFWQSLPPGARIVSVTLPSAATGNAAGQKEEEQMSLIKIVSGGQTGVDRAALDVALESGIEAGGWCPEGRPAEDGVIPDRYPVKELPGAGYRQRTKRNVIDSDGTVIIYFGTPVGGTELTISFCIKLKKPYVLVDGDELSVERATHKIDAFIARKKIPVLNVAGPRAGSEPRAYGYAKEVIRGVLQSRP